MRAMVGKAAIPSPLGMGRCPGRSFLGFPDVRLRASLCVPVQLGPRAFLVLAFWLLLKYVSAPDPLRGGRGEDGHVASSLCTSLLPALRPRPERRPTLCIVPNCTARSV